MSCSVNRFNIRVYGVFINDQDEVLLVHETMGDFSFTKFPGGGLEYCEGISDCLKREFREELDLKIDLIRHLYTTDFFQQSAFRKTDQLISVYYHVKPVDGNYEVNLHEQTDLKEEGFTKRQFFWKKRPELSPELLTFPIDKIVCSIVRELESSS